MNSQPQAPLPAARGRQGRRGPPQWPPGRKAEEVRGIWEWGAQGGQGTLGGWGAHKVGEHMGSTQGWRAHRAKKHVESGSTRGQGTLRFREHTGSGSGSKREHMGCGEDRGGEDLWPGSIQGGEHSGWGAPLPTPLLLAPPLALLAQGGRALGAHRGTVDAGAVQVRLVPLVLLALRGGGP